jgi:hypothetical protein
MGEHHGRLPLHGGRRIVAALKPRVNARYCAFAC